MSDMFDRLFQQHSKKHPVNLERLSRYSIKNDRWDRQEFDKLLLQQPVVDATRQKLADNIAGECGIDEAADIIWMLQKVRPDLLGEDGIRPSRQVNRRVNEEVRTLPQFGNVRRWTVGDPIWAARALEEMEPTLETLYDRLKESLRRQEEYEEALRQALEKKNEEQTAEEMLLRWTDDHPDADNEDDGPEKEQLEDAAQGAALAASEAQGAAGDALAALQSALNAAAPGIRQIMGAALGDANKSLENVNQMASAWGSEPGELMRLPAKERIRLAKKLGTPKFQRMAELFGSMSRDAFAEQKKKIIYVPEEIYDMGVGDDLARVIPPEFARLDLSEETEILFWKDFVQQHLVQYEMRGFEKINRGGIIYIHDGSSSMRDGNGDKEIWAKALGLALLQIARKQKRSFYGIQFGSSGQIRIDDFRDPRKLTPDQVIDFAEYFFNGGTDFQSPLREALKILKQEHADFGAVQADIVFATDGQAGISTKFMDDFKEQQRKLAFKVWGVAIGQDGQNDVQPEPISELCDGKVATIKTLLNSTDVRAIFRGL